MAKKSQNNSHRVFLENPYDIQTIFESLEISADHGKEMIYVDRLIATLRLDPYADITNLNYNILRDLGLMKLEKIA